MFRPSAPEVLGEHHDISSFSCGELLLDEWLKQRALKGGSRGTARTFVICDDETRVIGYYALSAGSVIRGDAPKPLQRNSPDHIPVLIMGRLAIDENYQGHGLGDALMKDAFLRVLGVSNHAGFMALLVNALTDNAARFYMRYGFVQSPFDPLTLFLPIRTIRQALEG